MLPNSPNTATLQQWLTALLVGKGNLQQKIHQVQRQFALPAQEVVAQKGKISIEKRLSIYATGYMLRLLECIEADMPSLHTYWGEDLFVMFAKAYLLTKPSHSFSLFDLSKDFPEFLEKTRPALPEADAYTQAKYDLPAELAKIERARLEAMRRQGTEGKPQEMPDVFAFFTGQEVFVESHPCLQLLALKLPLQHFYQQLLKGEKSEVPQPQASFLAVSRMYYRLHFTTLLPWQYHFLEKLQNEKTPQAVSHLLQEVAQKVQIPLGTLLAEINLWIPHAVQAGLLVAI